MRQGSQHLLEGELVWGSHKDRSRNLCRWRYQQRRWQILCKDLGYHQWPMSFCKHQSNHCIDVHHPCLEMCKLGCLLTCSRKIFERPRNVEVARGIRICFWVTFGVIGKFGTSEIERIDEEKRKSTSSTTRENVGAKFLPLWSSLWGGEEGLDLIFEGKVQSLGWEISDAVSKIS